MMLKQKELYIYLSTLTPKEMAIFKRVISFSVKKGNLYKILPSIQKADLIITNDIKIAEQYKSKYILMISHCVLPTKGKQYYIKSPLLVTKVMKKIEKIAIEIQKNPPEITKKIIPPKIDYAYHALVIDDSLPIRKQLELELRQNSVGTDFAESGEIALEKTQQKDYDLIFLDIVMPGIDGYEVCRKLRKIPKWKKTPIIMLSGKSSPLDEVKGVIAGCTTYLTKPINSKEFQKVIFRVKKWLDNFTTAS